MTRLQTLAALLACLAANLLATPSAARAAPQEEQAAVVATRAVPPFAMRRADGAWEGIAIELWQEVERRLALPTTYAEVELAEMLDGVAAGEYDAAAGALTVTAERERAMDFSHPFLSSGLGLAVSAEGGGGFWSMVRQIVSPTFLRAVLALVAVLLVCGVLVWALERRANPEQFGGGLSGVGSGFWWSAVTMTTVGYGDKAPRTLGGRLVGLVWMFASIIVISSFTAAIASSLTVNRMQTRIQGPEDLPGARLGVVGDSTGATWADERGLAATAFDDAGAALAALGAGELDAVVYDAPVLQYLVRAGAEDGVTVLPERVERQDYAIALPPGSALREDVNQVILDVTASPDWRRVLERYLGE